MLTRLRVKTKVRIFQRKKTQDIMAPYRGRTFCGAMSSEHGNTPSSSRKSDRFLEQLYDFSFSRKRLLCGVYLAKVVKNNL
jgi:hypothetical protein